MRALRSRSYHAGVAAQVELLPSARSSFPALRELIEWAEELDFAYAWIDTGSQEADLWHALDEKKIRRGVVGLHFAGTDPVALAFFLAEAPEQVRVVLDMEGTFHPKVIVGAAGSAWRAIIGSSNFTPAGFGTNTELNVLVSGNEDDEFFLELEAVMAEFWFRAEEITDGFIESYREQWRRRPRPPSTRLVGSRARRRPPKVRTDLEIEWPEYVALLRARPTEGSTSSPRTQISRPTYRSRRSRENCCERRDPSLISRTTMRGTSLVSDPASATSGPPEQTASSCGW